MRRGSSLYFAVVLVVSDALMTGLALFWAYELRFEAGLIPYKELHPWPMYAGLIPFQATTLVVLFGLLGLYRPRQAIAWAQEIQRIFSGVSISTVLVMLGRAWASADFHYSELLLAFAWLFSIVLVVLARAVAYGGLAVLRASRGRAERVLIVGTNEIGRTILEKIRQSPRLGYRPVGFLRCRPDVNAFEGLPVLGDAEEIGRVVREQKIDEVIIGIPGLSHADALRLVSLCQHEKVNIRIFPDLFQMMTSAVDISELNGLPLVSVRDLALKGYNVAIKRAMDLTLSAAGLVLLSPLMLLIALLIKLTSPDGSVFYTQERVGLDSKPFQILKFRSMHPDAEAETGPVWAKAGDPRTTGLGRLLRRFSSDELPQLINVLLGEMSLVGPRPERPYFVEQFKGRIPRYAERHLEKAGLTGWAQVNGLRGDTSIEERTAYDLWYVENWTPWLDLKILLRSLVVVFRGQNPY